MLFIAFLAAAAAAAAESQPPQALGVGTESCGAFLATKSQPMPRAVFMQWLQGFLTHYDISNKDGIGDITANTDFKGLAAWLDSYCAAKPLLPFGTAASALLLDLKDLQRQASAKRP